MRAFVSKLVLRINVSKRFSKQSCAVGLTVYVSKRTKYNSLLVSLLRVQSFLQCGGEK